MRREIIATDMMATGSSFSSLDIMSVIGDEHERAVPCRGGRTTGRATTGATTPAPPLILFALAGGCWPALMGLAARKIERKQQFRMKVETRFGDAYLFAQRDRDERSSFDEQPP